MRGKGVVVVAATNFLDRLDPAAIRDGRFDFKIEITPPDLPARIGLLRDGIRAAAAGVQVSDQTLETVARRWGGFSVARLRAIARQAGEAARKENRTTLDRDDLLAALRAVQAKRSTLPEDVPGLDELAMAPEQADALHGLAWRMKAIFAAEEAGASVPQGVLFFGPPGTGKTASARALAKAAGWAFFSTTGNELLQDPKKIDEIQARAEDARPAIIFIDEADDILGDRQMSGVRSITNRLLAAMDGAQGRAPDVVYIAATNHPGMLDPAVLRAGRFTEKVEFRLPDAEALVGVVGAWLAEKGWTVEGGASRAASMMKGMPVPNVKASLQAALNAKVARALRAGQPVQKHLDLQTLEAAIESVAPALDA